MALAPTQSLHNLEDAADKKPKAADIFVAKTYHSAINGR